MVSPDSRWPPGDETMTSMGSLESASSAINRRAASTAVTSVIVPKMRTVRDLNAFSSRNTLLESAGAAGIGGSMAAPACFDRVRRTSRPICDNHPNRRRLWQALGMSSGSNSDHGGADRQRLLAVAPRLLRTEADAEDTVQDAYLRATSARPHAPESMQAWLNTVVHNLAIDQLRRERLQRTYLESCARE